MKSPMFSMKKMRFAHPRRRCHGRRFWTAPRVCLGKDSDSWSLSRCSASFQSSFFGMVSLSESPSYLCGEEVEHKVEGKV